jgi:hypothetical protein
VCAREGVTVEKQFEKASGVMEQNKLTGNRARVKRYRAKHRRFDYAPSPAALEAIEKHRGLDTVIAGVLDHLILAGSQAITGNAKG